MPNNDSHQHVVKTSEQWNERIVEFWVVPRGCLCVELTPRGKTKIKIGEGNKYYSQLPYICDDDLSQYYTKTEVDNLLENLNRMAIMSTEEYDEKSDLPQTGNKLGDVRFVKSRNPSIKIDPDIYLWNGLRWVFVGDKFQDIDLSKYLKKTEFHELFDPVSEKVDEMYPMRHTHENKDILDQITAPFTVPEKEKLAGLENYDDTEIRELIHESGHTHPNKELLDTITPDSLWSESDREKFDSLHNYDDTEVKVRIEVLENISHTHENKDVLDQITAPFTTEDKTKLDSLHNDEVFRGTDGRYPGTSGNVPAPSTLDIGKFLSSDGTWKPAGYDIDFIGATENTNGMHGLVPAPLAGQESYYLRGDGTWAMIESDIEYKAGAGISITDVTPIDTDVTEKEISVVPATTETIGGVIVGDGLEIDEEGVLSTSGGKTYVAGDGIMISDGASSFELNENTVTNTEYFFNTQVTSNISGRIFTKYTTEPALGAVVYYGSSYTQPFFVGLTADSVKYGTNYDSHIWPNPNYPPFEYKGVTWYYSGNAYGMPGNVTDSSGHMQKLPGSYSVSTEADLQNIARAIIDAADIIMSPAKEISAKIGEGLSFDSNDAIQNEGLLSVTQDFDDKNHLTFGTAYGDIDITIPGGGGDSSETYVAGDAISVDDSTAPLTAPLTHFKWEISQTRAKAEGTVYVTLQVDEIEFYDENDQLITFSAIAGSFKSDSPSPPSPSYATTPTVQTPDKIIDNDITTKCCVTNFTSELDAMVFIFELDSTNPITAQDIKCYRYYTADDDTSADPVTWTLSVSPDGIEWFVVDTQTEFNVPTARETSTDYFTMTKPTIPAKSINVKYDDGLMLDAHGDLVVQTGKGIEISDNAVTAKLGVGLTFDNIDAITLDETIDLALNCDYSQ